MRRALYLLGKPQPTGRGQARSQRVLHPATRRKLLDTAPVPADRGAHRAARVAPHVIESPTRGPGTMSSEGRRSGGVSERTLGVTTLTSTGLRSAPRPRTRPDVKRARVKRRT